MYGQTDFENPTPVNIDDSTSYSSRQSTIFGEVSDNSNSQHYSSSGFHDRNMEIKGQSDTSEDPDIQPKTSRKRTIEMREKSYTLENQDIQSGIPFQRTVEGRRNSHILLVKDFPPSQCHEQTLGLGEKSSRNVKQITSMELEPQICTQEKILRKLGKILYNIERLHDKFDRYYDKGETFDPSKIAVVSEDNEEVEFPLESEHDIKIMEDSWAQAACFKKALCGTFPKNRGRRFAWKRGQRFKTTFHG